MRGLLRSEAFRGYLRISSATSLDRASGKERWRYKAAEFRAPPSYHDGAVYVGDMEGTFHCVDAGTGKKRSRNS